jgi:cGMP-dependent protein kinase
MEKLGGGDLFSAIRDIGRLSEDQMLFFTASIVLALEYVHARGVIYRDLKPENIMLNDKGFVKLIDFGCCSRKKRTYTFIGTVEYIAPEMILGKGYGNPIDWWALGVLAYEMACGPLPFGEGSTDPLDTFRDILEKPLALPAWLPADTADFLKCLIERSPELRLMGRECKEHPFFEGLQWNEIVMQSIAPPYNPPRPSQNHSTESSTESETEILREHARIPLSEDEADRELPDPNMDLSCFEGF